MTFEILEQWYFCQANFCIPFLVLISNPLPFLVVIQLYMLLGVLIAFKKKEKKINSVLLALYSFVFHVCFIIFYWAPSTQVMIITELICLAVFLIGVVHHILTVLYEIFVVAVKLFCKLCKVSRIVPKVAQNIKRNKVDKKIKNDPELNQPSNKPHKAGDL